MKYISTLALIYFCLILNLVNAASAKKDDLKLRLNKGEHYIYSITQENTIRDDSNAVLLKQNIALKIDQQVVDKLQNGNYLINASFVNFGIQVNFNGDVIRYHTDTVDKSNRLYKSLSFLKGIKLNYEVSPEGVVSNLSGFETIKNKMQVDKQLSGLLRSFGNERFIIELYNYITQKNVGVGSEWANSALLPDMMNLKYDINYSLKEKTANNLKLTQNASFNYSAELPKEMKRKGTVNENGTQEGFILIDPVTNMRLKSEVDQQINFSITDNTNQKTKADEPKKINTHTTMVVTKK